MLSEDPVCQYILSICSLCIKRNIPQKCVHSAFALQDYIHADCNMQNIWIYNKYVQFVFISSYILIDIHVHLII